MFGLISSFLSNKRLQVVLDEKTTQEYPVNTGVFQGTILGSSLFLKVINDLPNDVVCSIVICADDTSLYSKCDQAPVLWQQSESASKILSDLQDVVDFGRKWLVNFNAEKDQLVSSDQSNKTSPTDAKMDKPFLEEKISLKILRLSFSSKFDCVSHTISIAKIASKKI